MWLFFCTAYLIFARARRLDGHEHPVSHIQPVEDALRKPTHHLTMSHSSRNECRIYVGNLPPDIRTKDIQDLFHKFGKVTFVDLKNRRGPPFAFVEFEDAR